MKNLLMLRTSTLHRRTARLAVIGLFAALLSAAPFSAAFAATAPALGSAASFEVLAGTRVTCTDSALAGNVGVWTGTPPDVVQTSCPITGTIDAGNGVAKQAYIDFLSAYHALSLVPCGSTLSGDLSGQVLTPGVYCVDAASTTTSGTLTLNGSSTDTWIFKIGTLGTGALTGTSFSVVMADGGQVPCNNVYWWVAEGVTMTDSQFVGTILAGAAITITRGTFHGDALATAAVTLKDTTVTGCAANGGGGKSH